MIIKNAFVSETIGTYSTVIQIHVTIDSAPATLPNISVERKKEKGNQSAIAVNRLLFHLYTTQLTKVRWSSVNETCESSKDTLK